MNPTQIKKLKTIFLLYPEIKLVYLFGSRAKGGAGPLSDYDFAFFLDGANREKMAGLKLSLIAKVTTALKTDKVDILILNLTESPELKYNVIKDGKLIYEIEPYRMLAEPRILNEYFDFHSMLLRHGLTQS